MTWSRICQAGLQGKRSRGAPLMWCCCMQSALEIFRSQGLQRSEKAPNLSQPAMIRNVALSTWRVLRGGRLACARLTQDLESSDWTAQMVLVMTSVFLPDLLFAAKISQRVAASEMYQIDDKNFNASIHSLVSRSMQGDRGKDRRQHPIIHRLSKPALWSWTTMLKDWKAAERAAPRTASNPGPR